MDRERRGRVKVIDYLLVAPANNLQNKIINKNRKTNRRCRVCCSFFSFHYEPPWVFVGFGYQNPLIFKYVLFIFCFYKIVQGVRKWFSFPKGCKLQNELRTAELHHEEMLMNWDTDRHLNLSLWHCYWRKYFSTCSIATMCFQWILGNAYYRISKNISSSRLLQALQTYQVFIYCYRE